MNYEKLVQELLFFTQGIAVITLYIILWNKLSHLIENLSNKKQHLLLLVIVLFMYTTSNYSFYFMKEWGI